MNYEDSLELFLHLVTVRAWWYRHQIDLLPPEEQPRFADPDNTWVDIRAIIGGETIIFPACKIMGESVIGKRCVIWPNTTIINLILGDGVSFGLPFQKNSKIGKDSKIGALAEVNRCEIGERVKMQHHGYLGDTAVGDGSNIGAGTITANYDGERKNPTILGPECFTGVNSNIIAPNEFPEGTYIAAGSTVPPNLKKVRYLFPFNLIISRVKEVVIKERKKK